MYDGSDVGLLVGGTLVGVDVESSDDIQHRHDIHDTAERVVRLCVVQSSS